VIGLSALLQQAQGLLSANQTEKVSNLFAGPASNLGELQSSYQQCITAWQQYNDYLVNGHYYKKKNALFKDYSFLQKMHTTLEQQKLIAQQDLQLTQEASSAIDSLYSQKVMSRQDLRDQTSKLLGKQMGLPQLESSLLNNEQQQVDKSKEIEVLEHCISQEKVIFQQAVGTLKSSVDDWMRKYIITAPVDGKVVFIIPLQEHQFMQSGKIIGYVNPMDSRYYAQVTLPQGNFGKVGVGEKVQLRFDAYPYQEFGFIEGRLKYISKIPSDSGFLASIELSIWLITNYRREIQYRSGLTSQALIITRDARLLQRFYYGIIKSMHQ
jgi:HlyD family secretion protein